MLAQQHGCPLAGFGHVDVRVGAIRHQSVGQGKHAFGHISVQVKAGHNGQLGPHHRADAGDQLAFAVVGVFSHSGAMQIEVHAVQALHHRRTHVFENGGTNALESIPGHIRRRCGTGPRRRHQLPAFATCRVDEAARWNVHARHLVQHGLSAHIGWKGLAAFKGRPMGQAGGKGVGFVLVASHQNAGHGTCLKSFRFQVRARLQAQHRAGDGCSLAVGWRKPRL